MIRHLLGHQFTLEVKTFATLFSFWRFLADITSFWIHYTLHIHINYFPADTSLLFHKLIKQLNEIWVALTSAILEGNLIHYTTIFMTYIDSSFPVYFRSFLGKLLRGLFASAQIIIAQYTCQWAISSSCSLLADTMKFENSASESPTTWIGHLTENSYNSNTQSFQGFFFVGSHRHRKTSQRGQCFTRQLSFTFRNINIDTNSENF